MIIGILILFGAIGFPVIEDVLDINRIKKAIKTPAKKLKLSTRISLYTSIILNSDKNNLIKIRVSWKVRVWVKDPEVYEPLPLLWSCDGHVVEDDYEYYYFVGPKQTMIRSIR